MKKEDIQRARDLAERINETESRLRFLSGLSGKGIDTRLTLSITRLHTDRKETIHDSNLIESVVIEKIKELSKLSIRLEKELEEI